MKVITLLIELLVIVLSKIDTSIDCNKYYSKFDTKELPFDFKGDAILNQGSNDVQINLGYTDNLFEDPLYFGLITADGKPRNTTCLELIIIQFGNQYHNSIGKITKFDGRSSSNPENKQRNYTLLIPKSQLSERQFQYNSIIYQGFFSFIFESVEEAQAKYEYIFDFNITLNKTSDRSNQPEEQNNTELQGNLIWCTNWNCLISLDQSPTIYYKDIFTLKQFITPTGMSQIALTNTEVWATGNGLNKKLTPIVVNSIVPGQVKILLSAEIAWENITLIVTSYLEATHPTKSITNSLQTSFIPLDLHLAKNDTVLLWCSTPNCSSFLSTIPTLYLNDTLTLKLIVLKSNMQKYYFNETEIWYTGEVLNKKIIPINLNQEVRGEIKIQLRLEYDLGMFRIKVDSKLCIPNFQNIEISIEIDAIIHRENCQQNTSLFSNKSLNFFLLIIFFTFII
ncbi:unnamed protein product [Paramecium sonneborni]|uniref:Transmembrane protein n=1 Tax=Paramecium sonneborni TaxID=65129 RepID=A0A8S1RIN4_9CILI|nr:unnamed protein product [Paramecium sonneborni]